MTVVIALLALLLHLVLMLAAAPTITGLAATIAARLNGRTGPPLLLPWRDLLRLARKSRTDPESVSFVSNLGPAVALAATLAAALLVPSFTLGMAFAPLADLLVVASLLVLARAALALAALDSGAALPGLEQQSASALAILTEPALILTVTALALVAGSFNIDIVIAQQLQGMMMPAAAVALVALLTLLAGEQHARTAASHSQTAAGITLAMVLMAGWLRRLVWFDLIGALFLPFGIAPSGSAPIAWLPGLGLWVLKTFAFTVILAAIEARLGRVPRQSLLSIAGLAALLAVLATIMVLANAGTV